MELWTIRNEKTEVEKESEKTPNQRIKGNKREKKGIFAREFAIEKKKTRVCHLNKKIIMEIAMSALWPFLPCFSKSGFKFLRRGRKFADYVYSLR